MRIIFTGSSEFAVPALEALAYQQKHPLVGVITQPDSQKGRGLTVSIPPVKATALEYSLPVWQPADINNPEFIAELREQLPDLMVVASYGQMLSESVLNLPARGCINIHPSLLPKYRGASPVNYAILNGDKQTGITIFKIVKQMDAGPILKQVTIDIGDNETAEELSNRLAGQSAEILIGLLDEIANGTVILTPQDGTKATFAPKFNKADGEINWHKTSRQIFNQIRALTPWPGAYTYFQPPGKASFPLGLTRLRGSASGTDKIDICGATMPNLDAPNIPNHPQSRTCPDLSGCGGTVGQPGVIMAISGNGIMVACGDADMLNITKVKPAGGRALTAKEFINGYRLKIGDKFGN